MLKEFQIRVNAMSKDHKDKNEDGSRPARPVCHARESPNQVISDIVTEIIEALCDVEKQERECQNTEEVCEKIREVNKEIKEIPGVTLASMDAKALYPSVKLEECVKISK